MHRLGLDRTLSEPSVLFSSTHITQLSKPFQWALVGKFSQGYNKENPNLGRPPVEELQKSFVALDLKSDFQLGLLDNRHVLIQLRHHEYYLRLYSRPVWYVKGLPMRIFKWTSCGSRVSNCTGMGFLPTVANSFF